MSVAWHMQAQLCHNVADTPDSLRVCETGLMEREEGCVCVCVVGVNIILRYHLTGFSVFQLCSKFRPHMG